MEYQEIEKALDSYKSIYLYGAGIIAYGVYRALEELWGIHVKGFLVTERDTQIKEIEGTPVLTYEDSQIDRNESLIIIATPEEYHRSIEQSLKQYGISDYWKLDSHKEYVLMGNYLKKVRSLSLIEDYETDSGRTSCDHVGVYMAVSHKDRPLTKTYIEKPWVKRIQVGAALTSERICELTDLGEESISHKNALYGELTASYYGWKYGKYDVTGLFHYRRVLHVTEEQLRLLEKGTLDVILPLPFVCTPDASGQYGRYLLYSDVDVMLDVIKELDKEHFRETLDILKTPYLYNYNMLIAKREVFDDYCRWMFPLLEEIASRCEKENKNRMPRYIGRVGEVLTSVYFMRNEKRWKIAHAEKVWRI